MNLCGQILDWIPVRLRRRLKSEFSASCVEKKRGGGRRDSASLRNMLICFAKYVSRWKLLGFFSQWQHSRKCDSHPYWRILQLHSLRPEPNICVTAKHSEAEFLAGDGPQLMFVFSKIVIITGVKKQFLRANSLTCSLKIISLPLSLHFNASVL